MKQTPLELLIDSKLKTCLTFVILYFHDMAESKVDKQKESHNRVNLESLQKVILVQNY